MITYIVHLLKSFLVYLIENILIVDCLFLIASFHVSSWLNITIKYNSLMYALRMNIFVKLMVKTILSYINDFDVLI
jgi:hypothetical protein